MRFARIAAIALAATLSIAAAPHPDWTATVTMGEGGSHVLGNPAAKVRLTEFISYTCPHCAHFHKEADGALKLGYVLPGKVSIEIRHLVLDPVDLSAALLTNCGDPKRFFGNHNAFLQSQDRWIETMGKASDGQKARWTSGSIASRMKAIANDFGFYRMMEQRGYRRSDLDRCLGDEAMTRRLTTQTQEAMRDGVEGTPSFMIDGTLLAGTHDWQSLSAQLQARF
jgi:protein-disulfide isomerase